jgi:hypothetical protein
MAILFNRCLRACIRFTALVLGVFMGSTVAFSCGVYGMPTTTYRVEGAVRRAEDGTVIKGIEVTLWDMKMNSYADGSWSFRGIGDGTCGDWRPCLVTATDVDGPDNGGEYATTSVPFQTVTIDGNTTAVGVQIIMPRVK